jgi:hypothetical protein
MTGHRNPKRLARLAVLLCFASGAACQCQRRSNLLQLPPAVHNSFTQAASKPLDVLFVVDNSLAMLPFQQKAAQNISDFVGFLSDAHVDFQIAVTSGDAVGYESPVGGSGRFSKAGGVAIVKADTPNAVSVLQQNLQLGNAGSNVQLPINAAMLALGLTKAQKGVPPAGNEGLVRSGARLAIVFVTDGEDHLFEVSPDSSSDLQGELMVALRNLKGAGNLGLVFMEGILFDGAFTEPSLHPERLPVATCKDPDASRDQAVSSTLLELLLNVPFPAYVSSICGDSLSSLRKLGVDAAGFTTRFVLSEPADSAGMVDCQGDAQPFCVLVDGQPLAPTDFRYDASTTSIVFDQGYVPPAAAMIEVSFEAVTVNAVMTADDGGFYTTCSADTDCPAGVACAAGTCHLTCAASSDCASGFVCGPASSCVCSGDSGCPAGTFCAASGSCQQVLPCLLDSDCAAGELCEARTQRCVTAGSCALDNATAQYFDFLIAAYDCQEGTRCDGTHCVSGCTNSYDCPSGKTCNDSSVCVAGCSRTEDCCLGQICMSGACVQGKVGSLALCDLDSCLGDLSQCRSANGQCDTRFDMQFGCVPIAASAGDCAKGYSLNQVPTVTTHCTFTGHECTGGRACSATLENPTGTCGCVSSSECPASTVCQDLGYGRYCFGPAACSPTFQCIEAFHSQGALCDDHF